MTLPHAYSSGSLEQKWLPKWWPYHMHLLKSPFFDVLIFISFYQLVTISTQAKKWRNKAIKHENNTTFSMQCNQVNLWVEHYQHKPSSAKYFDRNSKGTLQQLTNKNFRWSLKSFLWDDVTKKRNSSSIMLKLSELSSCISKE